MLQADRERLGLQSIEILSFWLCFDQCWILEEEDAALTPRMRCYLRERKKGASGMKPVLQWAPATAHSRAMLARKRKKAEMMKALFQHESQHQALFTCPTISFNIWNVIMWKSVNAWHIISWVCIIYCIPHMSASRSYVVQCVCVSWQFIPLQWRSECGGKFWIIIIILMVLAISVMIALYSK